MPALAAFYKVLDTTKPTPILEEPPLPESIVLRLALLLASIVNLSAGLGLTGLYLGRRSVNDLPILVLVVGLSLFVQGFYTIGYLRGWWARLGERATQLFVAGQCLAALAGALETVHGILYNLHPVNGDQEFGPLTAAILLGTQAVLALILVSREETQPVRGRA